MAPCVVRHLWTKFVSTKYGWTGTIGELEVLPALSPKTNV